MVDQMSLIEHRHSEKEEKYSGNQFNVIFSHGKMGSITPISLRRPSEKSARTTQPTHIEIIEALRLCLRIASAIIS